MKIIFGAPGGTRTRDPQIMVLDPRLELRMDLYPTKSVALPTELPEHIRELDAHLPYQREPQCVYPQGWLLSNVGALYFVEGNGVACPL